MILIHFSNRPFIMEEKSYEQKIAIKPNGLWLSDESQKDSWFNWCQQEQFNLKNLKHRTEFDVDTKHIFLIENEKELKAFNDIYAAPIDPTSTFLWPKWDKLSQNYKGIIISPYQFKFRFDLNFLWYYGWDCASGCIWDLSCLKENIGSSASAESIGFVTELKS